MAGSVKYLFGLLILVFLALPAQTLAQDDEKVKQTQAMSPKVGNKLLEIQEIVEAQNYQQAMQELNDLRNDDGLSPYETAQIWNLTAYAYYLMENYQGAINAYENVLRQEDLPEALQQSTLKTLSQLYFILEDYDKALVTVQRLIAMLDEPSADVLMLLGQAYFQKGDYVNAEDPITRGIELYREQGRVPKENWLLLLRVIYFEKKDYQSMIRVVKELINHYPKDQYIMTLAGAYSELGDTKKQLALTETLYEKGLLDRQSHIVNLAHLYLLHNSPYKAAKLLDKHIDDSSIDGKVRNLRLLSQSWYQAREYEKSIPPLELAAGMSDDGELYVRLAQSYMDLDRWSDAVQALENGLAKGGVQRLDVANLMLGMSLFNQKRLSRARRAFEIAAEDQRSVRAAAQWIGYVDSELRRQETLEQVVPTQQPKERDAMLEALEEST